ncbi:MAG TPA: uroporphyrinogen-III synthase [Accumulibacter sp.]|nr:uroporphyrinogen-III synthase [Accumulibacter sp.]HMW16655.1 uroporphyrinogen-III synthase [Accumulibacter sp.]HMX23452.1 uroporphyrinogen-III synthase [Accumulibacter sp.]HNC17702.1 uroporphyrinogen-III synthase [Accumulibacter sp.]HND79400.1 uroporphyrinogen-III synthase [Accumulibacter sp.]
MNGVDPGILRGKRIVVTRPLAQSGPLADMIASHGGQPFVFPLLEISAADDPRPLQAAIERLETFSLAVFISPNAVDFSVPSMLARQPWPDDLQALALGPGSAARLSAYGIANTLLPEERFDSESLLELPVLRPSYIDGRRVLILRGNGGRELLAQTLRQRGAIVDCVACYRRSGPTEITPLAKRLRCRELDALVVSSSEALRYLFEMLEVEGRADLQNTPLFVPHPRIAELALALGLRRVITSEPTDAGLFAALCRYRWHTHG